MYGCGYVYNGVEIGEALMNTCRVLMKRVSRLECEVRWGGDSKYIEPCTSSIDYSSFCNVIAAAEVLEEHASDDGKFMEICKHVKFFRSRG